VHQIGWRIIAAFLFGWIMAACSVGDAGSDGEDKVVNVYNWSDYIDEAALPAFERETGIAVNYDVYDSNDVLEGKLLAGNTGYDIVVPSGAFFEVQRLAGLFQELDKSLLPNLENLDPRILAKIEAMDPGHRYAVPYLWGTTGLGVNVDKVLERVPDAPLDSWALLFDPAIVSRLADCGVTVLDAADEVSEILLNYIGYDPASHDLDQLREALAVLEPIRQYVRYFHSSQYIDDLANGEVCIALGWSGDIYQARDDAVDGVNIKYVVPKESTVLWFDLMAIPADAPHPHNAHLLINYLLQPKVAAANSNATFYPSPNAAAYPYIDPAITGDPSIYLPEPVFDALFAARATPPRVARIRNRIWTALKTGR